MGADTSRPSVILGSTSIETRTLRGTPTANGMSDVRTVQDYRNISGSSSREPYNQTGEELDAKTIEIILKASNVGLFGVLWTLIKNTKSAATPRSSKQGARNTAINSKSKTNELRDVKPQTKTSKNKHRRKSILMSDQSDSDDEKPNSNKGPESGPSESETPSGDIVNHFIRRLLRFVRIGGISQEIAERTNTPRTLPRSEIFLPGASQFQDRHCNIPGWEAGHLVRVRLNDDLYTISRQDFETLRDFLGRTEDVPRYANEWHGIGGDIDRLQERFIHEINSINYRGEFTEYAEEILGRYIEAFLSVFRTAMESSRYNDAQRAQLQRVIDAIWEVDIIALFEKGREGLDFLLFNNNWVTVRVPVLNDD